VNNRKPAKMMEQIEARLKKCWLLAVSTVDGPAYGGKAQFQG